MNRSRQDSPLGSDDAQLVQPTGEAAKRNHGSGLVQQDGVQIHSPHRRAAPVEDGPSVVVADEESLPQGRRASREKTLVIRDRRAIEDVQARLALERTKAERKRMLKGIGLWSLAALIAFGLGGGLALWAGGGNEKESQAAPSSETPP